ncbi:4137_t:CDS:10 [Paraglomus occultum]|uniref:4137_t:CDS:1 n=1 Tax=Paraglomus occultum TaxID=144539 RepID=A0A9N9AKX9_9GLOM|nr:4137_t:CDS:10 [Paraglomus occultum]
MASSDGEKPISTRENTETNAGFSVVKGKRIKLNDPATLAFPPLSIGLGKVPIEEAMPILCKVIKEFIDSHKDQRYFLVLVEEDHEILEYFRQASGNLWTFKSEMPDHCELTRDERLLLRKDVFDDQAMEDDRKCRFIACETTWRLKPDVTPFSRKVYKAAGSDLAKRIKEAYPQPGALGEAYPVSLPPESNIRKNKGIEQIIYVVAPNMNPARSDHLPLDEAKKSLTKSYQSMLNAFWSVANDNDYSPSNSLVTEHNEKKRKSSVEIPVAAAKSSQIHQPRNERSLYSNDWSRVLWEYCSNPEAFPSDIVYHYDDDVVITWDKFPKAQKHLLVMPRRRIEYIDDLKKSDIDTIELLKKKGQWVIDRLKEENAKLDFRMGFHAMPSMRQLHMHVISQDFNAPALKTKRHWNSFTTFFFIPVDNLLDVLRGKGEVTIDNEYYNRLLKGRLRCHRCEKEFKTMPMLKDHIRLHWE